MSELARKLAGKFIVIDGPDGAGKSTQLKLLAEHLGSRGVQVTQTRDPGGTVIGDKIRRILLDNDHDEMVTGCEIMLYMASRVQLMGEVIAPALAAGRCVLCDRWVSSTIAYQVAEGEATAKEIMDIYQIALRGHRPDLTIILDLPAEVGLARLPAQPDRMEAKGLEFHQKVRDLFLTQVQVQSDTKPKVLTVVDGNGSIEQVQQRLVSCIENWSFPA